MPALSTRSKVILDLVTELRTERERVLDRARVLEQTIGELQSRVASPSNGAPSHHAASGDIENAREGKAWDFSGKGKPAATREILLHFGRTMNSTEILDILQKNGMSIGGGSFRARRINLYSTLVRSPLVKRVSGGLWALPEWENQP